MLPSLGGGPGLIEFNSLENPEMKNFSDTAPDWRIITPGMNLTGLCNNNACKAYNDYVTCQKGFGKFNMSKEIYISKCPMKDCQKTLKCNVLLM